MNEPGELDGPGFASAGAGGDIDVLSSAVGTPMPCPDTEASNALRKRLCDVDAYLAWTAQLATMLPAGAWWWADEGAIQTAHTVTFCGRPDTLKAFWTSHHGVWRLDVIHNPHASKSCYRIFMQVRCSRGEPADDDPTWVLADIRPGYIRGLLTAMGALPATGMAATTTQGG